MTIVASILRDAALALDSRLEAEVLLSHVLGRERAWLYAHGTRPVDRSDQIAFDQLIQRRRAGEPVAYIVGYREFYGRQFDVSPAVLIPRPETELLVDLALDLLKTPSPRVVDVGTGSGCIGLTLAAERPDWEVTVLDQSNEALEVCTSNARKLGLDRVNIIQSDLLASVRTQQFDCIVSNPPYVAEDDPHLQRGDLRFEPQLALTSGRDGLKLIRRLISQAARQLTPGGLLLIEHGYDQAAAIRHIVAECGFTGATTHPDLANIDRVTLARLRETFL
jgi:release factor glutamine methyltransferase